MKNKEIQSNEIWNDNKKSGLKDFIILHAKAQSKEQKLRNELLAIQYQKEDYKEVKIYLPNLLISAKISSVAWFLSVVYCIIFLNYFIVNTSIKQ